MKLYYLTNARMPTQLAHGVHIAEMVSTLGKQGHAVELIIPKRRNPLGEDIGAYYDVPVLFQTTRLATIDLVHWGRLGTYLQELSFTFSAWRYLKNKSDGIIYIRGERVFYLLSRLLRHIPIFIETHKKPSRKSILKSFSGAAGIITVTNFYATELKKMSVLSPERVLAAPDAVNLDKFENTHLENKRTVLDIPHNHVVIGYIGKMTTFSKTKGIEEILNGFSAALKSENNILLLIVGPELKEIPDIIEALKRLEISKEHYRIIPHIPYSEVPAYLKASDILIVPYPNEGHYTHYMSPLKLFEYIASGKAIISTDLPAIREVVSPQEVHFVEPGNAESFRAGMIALIGDGELRKSLGIQAKKKSLEFTWTKRARAITTFIEQCTSKKI